MSWKKHFTFVDTKKNPNDNITHIGPNASTGKYASYLPEYYAGNPQRIERYKQYDVMDMDSEVNTSLDTISDFATQSDEYRKSPFTLNFNGDISSTESEILITALKQWTRLNDFDKRLWSIFRAVIKYGDCTFVRDPETFKWVWIDPSKVDAIVVNTAKGKEPEEYIIRDIDFAIDESILTKPKHGVGGLNTTPGNIGKVQQYKNSTTVGVNYGETVSISSSSIIHLSLTEGMDTNWPFGNSILEGVFKVFKQKELLEDAVLIYRVQRAPERRVFYIDVGEMPPHKAMAFVERIKNEIHQKRIPNRTGGSNNIVDAAYNPMSMLEDYFFAQTSDSRGSKVETLPGGDNLGEIDDLKFFDNKLKRGLGVPSSYLPSGPDDGTAAMSDGRVGTAYMQEYRFSKYCKRLQMLVSGTFDREFKMFLKKREYNIDSSLFELYFNEPQSFSKFRQIEIDSAQINVFQPLSDVSYLSKRFILKRFLNMDETEIMENEKLWREENPGKVKKTNDDNADSPNLSSVGIRPPHEDIPGDENNFDDIDAGNASPISGDEFSSDSDNTNDLFT